METILQYRSKPPSQKNKAALRSKGTGIASSRVPSVRRICLYTSAALALVALTSSTGVEAVKHENFKTCNQSGFCRRNRAYADNAAATASWSSPYELDSATVSIEGGVLKGTVWKTLEDGAEKVELPLLFSLYTNGVARLQIDEAKRLKGDIELRRESIARKERYNEAEKWALAGGLQLNEAATIEKLDGGAATKVKYGAVSPFEAVITHKPFEVKFMRDGEVHVVLNERNLMNVEHWRKKTDPKEGEEENLEWDEAFGGNTDSKPRGPESVALDITFPGYDHVYGIPEHATSLALKPTRGGEGAYTEPYRLYNSDVFEYETDSPMTLYGSIPFMQAHKKGSTVGVFWLNAAETWIDVIKQNKANPLSLGTTKASTQTHWISESGVLDVFVLLGPNASWLYRQYGELTGYTTLPQLFSIAYHQCRWNYVSQDDVKEVDRKFDQFDIPYDVIWLDIEYTDEKKYFTWDPRTFGNPIEMVDNLGKRDRKLVAIIDPHIKKTDGYSVSEELVTKQYGAKDKAGSTYEGWCWPGSSNWVDGFNPLAVSWWVEQFKYNKFIGSKPNVHIWNDMNEPSVFNGPETTMPKDNLFHGNWEHRDLHNLYGATFHNATYTAMIERDGNKIEDQKRPFILTRAFFAGSQRTAAMWTGDNEAKWEHLQAAFPMLLSQGISGMPFAGADVGGFFGNPSKELLTRWYQAGAFYPFFRGHAHIDAKRREPYLAGEPYTSVIRDAIRLRYALLPAWYSAFHRASVDGMPIIRPMFVMFPDNEAGFAIDDQFFLGDSGLLVKPIVHEGSTTTSIFLPDPEVYYDYNDHTVFRGESKNVEIAAPLERIPMLMRGGHIFARRDRPRRSSGLMKHDPFTLIVSVNADNVAGGVVYLDDGESFAYKKGDYVHRAFTFNGPQKILKSDNLNPHAVVKGAPNTFAKSLKGVRIEKIVLVGLKNTVYEGKKKVTVQSGGKRWDAQITIVPAKDGKAASVTIKDPKVEIAHDWSIIFD
ncbi:glycosyl hydrolases family 31-domain-containing protein [Peziza echinospora]|nr:glycosyl hydrolases family 31-domain-containing protein [Peziza echinospora]